MYKRNVNPVCLREQVTPDVYTKRLIDDGYTAELCLSAFYLGRALRAHAYKGERHGVMYTGDGKEKSGNQKAMPGKGLSN